MIPAWKLRRELDRIGQKIRALLAYPFESYIQSAYDKRFPHQLNVTDGQLVRTEKVAILLVYQPKGILASTLRECEYLVENGYSPLIVSNCPLGNANLAVLESLSWKIVERPNFGYDFGGYRDGVRFLQHLKVEPRTLLIKNDSIWFPLHEKADVLRRLETSLANVNGIILHEDVRRRSTFSSRKTFLESYFYLFDEAAIQSESFRDYWRKYRVSSNKLNAVYRGERAFCDMMRQGGLSIAGQVDRDAFLSKIGQQTPQFLRKTLEYAAYIDADFSASGDQLLQQYENTIEWASRAAAHISAVTRKRNINASFCFATINLFGVASIKKSKGVFLKKSYETIHGATRRQYLRAVAAGDVPTPFAEVLAEIEARISSNSEN